MAQIYCIYNDINDKLYAGKTLKNYIKRFKEHISDSKREKLKSRPLYHAINKYGAKNFHIMLLEECSIEESSILEQEYICHFHSFGGKYGYNATIGGDGSPYINYDNVLLLWDQGFTVKEISDKMLICVDSISHYLHNIGIPKETIINRSARHSGKKINMIDKKTNEIIKTFDSAYEAARYINPEKEQTARKHINNCCNYLDKFKTAYGYKWSYTE